MEYRVQQKAIVWYETTVEADTPEEAIQIVQQGESSWEQAEGDGPDFLDYYWYSDDNGDEGELDGSKL